MRNHLGNTDYADHPYRQVAIHILENIAEMKGKPKMFDGEQWFTYEDMIVDALIAYYLDRLPEKWVCSNEDPL